MIEKSSSASFTLATIAILGQPPRFSLIERRHGSCMRHTCRIGRSAMISKVLSYLKRGEVFLGLLLMLLGGVINT
jgi:hypothetical protein